MESYFHVLKPRSYIHKSHTIKFSSTLLFCWKLLSFDLALNEDQFRSHASIDNKVWAKWPFRIFNQIFPQPIPALSNTCTTSCWYATWSCNVRHFVHFLQTVLPRKREFRFLQWDRLQYVQKLLITIDFREKKRFPLNEMQPTSFKPSDSFLKRPR